MRQIIILVVDFINSKHYYFIQHMKFFFSNLSKLLLILLISVSSLFPISVIYLSNHCDNVPEINLDKSISAYSRWEHMTCKFKKMGLELTIIPTRDMQRFLPKLRSRSTKYVIMDTADLSPHHRDLYFSCVLKKKRVLIAFEPPTVDPLTYNPEFLRKFTKIFTWDNNLVDGKIFYKMYHFVLKPMIENRVSFRDKKFSCMVFSNRSSNYPLELYSLRKKIIRFFSNKSSLFDLYGTGWPENTPNYFGHIACKEEVIKNYKFCFAMENTRDLSGYLTEKIWDVFHAGAIPIYLGDSGVEQEVPADCFIDLRKFKRFEQLVTYLETMTEDEYNRRIMCIREFLDSDIARKYTFEFYVSTIVDVLSK